MARTEPGSVTRVALTLPWRMVRFLGRLIRRFFVTVGVAAALVALGYIEFESIVEAVDALVAGRANVDEVLGALLSRPARSEAI